jgi:hypothetical protein
VNPVNEVIRATKEILETPEFRGNPERKVILVSRASLVIRATLAKKVIVGK